MLHNPASLAHARTGAFGHLTKHTNIPLAYLDAYLTIGLVM